MNMLAQRCASREVYRGPCLWCGRAEAEACPITDPSQEVKAARARLARPPRPVGRPKAEALAPLGLPVPRPPLRFTPPADLAKGKAAPAPGRREFDPASLKRSRP